MPFCCATCFPDLSSLQVYTDDTLSKILRILQNNDTLSSGFRRRRRITNFSPLAKNITKQNLHICYSTNKELLYLMLHLKSSRGSLFKATTCIQQTWVKISLVPVWVIGGGRKGIWPELLPCTSKSPTLLVGTPKPLNKGGESVTTSLMLQLVLHIFFCYFCVLGSNFTSWCCQNLSRLFLKALIIFVATSVILPSAQWLF